MSVLSVAKKLNKEFSNNNLAIMADVVPQYERFSSGAVGMDFPLYGGLPLGRMVVFAGLEHSGKTTAACTQMAAYQRKFPNTVCVYVDVEHSLDLEFQSAMTGIDLTKLVYFNPENMSGEQILDCVLEFQQEEDIGLIVLDSIPALVSSKDYDTPVEEDKGRAGGIAKPLAKFIKKMVDQLSAKKNILIMINQVREVGTTFTGATIYGEPGGHSVRYYPSIKVRFGTRTFTKGDKVDLSDGEEADGFRLKFKITKNKTASTQRGGGFITYRYDGGLDWKHDLLEVALKYDFIQRPNNLTYVLTDLNTGEIYKDSETGELLKFKGKANLLSYLDSHVDFQTEYLKMINEYLSHTDNKYGSLLDQRDNAEIDAQEESVNGHNEVTQEQFENAELKKKGKRLL